MNRPGMFLALACGMAALACGSTAAPPRQSTRAAAPDVAAPALTSTGAPMDAGVLTDDAHPFAGSNADATDLISRAVDGKHAEIAKCTHAFRIRKKMPHDKITVSFGIDQEGRLLGVTAKGREDTAFKRCIQEAVTDAPFPRSHAGVITVTKVYEELVLP